MSEWADPEPYAALRRLAGEVADVVGVGKVEVAGGTVVVSLPPVKRHEVAVWRLWRQLDAQVGASHPGCIAYSGASVEDPDLGRLRRPDLMVFPAVCLEDEGTPLRPADVLLAVEIVSWANPRGDYGEKVADYAAMGIPHYVIVDPRGGTGVVHATPGYRHRTPFVFGDTVRVGPWKLDTSVLLTYGPPRATCGGSAS
ncbi:Uma2 family endonuclease [Actinacidiphila epipremni]|uniref:Uma2 family endonuclease n=1 Tax=Actinacidiphila epipremni TaxID=2053013 RepID=A0ABX0ZKP5_9ACTN|nr:Uma2 family endonuclease [Actinacidiphila epipremni]NJP44434.1 Uma2 family endonuclease [Actinacidiphila epipremni]